MEEKPTSTKTGSSLTVLPIKKYIVYVLIGGLIVSALISIISVLVGHFGDTAGRALATTASIMIHSLIGLAFLSIGHSRTRSRTLVLNTLLTIVVASMLTSMLGIWNIINGETTGDLYGSFILAFIAVIIIDQLLTVHLNDKLIRLMAYSTSSIVAIAFVSLLPWIFQDSNYDLFDFYYRAVGALFILATTMVILTAIFEQLHVMKHPELAAKNANPHAMPLWIKVLLGVIVLVFGGWIIIPIIAALVFSTPF